MSVQPGTYNIALQRRADYYVTLQFKDSTDTAIDLTGWTVAAQIWTEERTTKIADFNVTYTDRVNGTIKLSLTTAQTVLIDQTYYYDVLLTNTTGLKEYYLEGSISAGEGYTA